jgi:Uma2 family endonuclease
MSAERIQQVRIKNRIWAALDRAITASGLDGEALGDGVTIEVDENTDYEPDAGVNRGPPAPPDAVAAANPVIVVEVLSPTTQAVDTGDKLADYFCVASIQHYLIVSARRREIIHHQRNGTEIVSRLSTWYRSVLIRPALRSTLPRSTRVWDSATPVCLANARRRSGLGWPRSTLVRSGRVPAPFLRRQCRWALPLPTRLRLRQGASRPRRG